MSDLGFLLESFQQKAWKFLDNFRVIQYFSMDWQQVKAFIYIISIQSMQVEQIFRTCQESS